MTRPHDARNDSTAPEVAISTLTGEICRLDARAGSGPEGDRASGAKRRLLLTAGSAALVLAFIGAILPVMPTTPFLLLSAYCYARSSQRCHSWLTTNRFFGKYVTQVAQGRRLSVRTKTVLMASSWLTALVSAIWLAPNTTVRLVSVSMAAAMTLYIVLQGRRRAQPQTVKARSPRG